MDFIFFYYGYKTNALIVFFFFFKKIRIILKRVLVMDGTDGNLHGF